MAEMDVGVSMVSGDSQTDQQSSFAHKLSSFQERENMELSVSEFAPASGDRVPKDALSSVGEGSGLTSAGPPPPLPEPELAQGAESYFSVGPPKLEDLISFERAGSFTAVGEDFDLPKEEVLLQDTRLTAKRAKVKIVEDFIETDLHGRGFKGAFPGVENAEEKVKNLALSRAEKIARQHMERLPGEVISYDTYGRADPRIFGEGAHIQSKKEAYAKMMHLRARAVEQKTEVYMAPAHPRLTGASVVTKAEHERVQSVINDIRNQKKSIRHEMEEQRRRARELDMQKLMDEEKEKELQARAKIIKQREGFSGAFEQYMNIGVDSVDDRIEHQEKFSENIARFQSDRGTSKEAEIQEDIAANMGAQPSSAGMLRAKFENGDKEEAPSDTVGVSSQEPEPFVRPSSGAVSTLMAKFSGEVEPSSTEPVVSSKTDDLEPTSEEVSSSKKKKKTSSKKKLAATAESAAEVVDEAVVGVTAAGASAAASVVKKTKKVKSAAGTVGAEGTEKVKKVAKKKKAVPSEPEPVAA